MDRNGELNLFEIGLLVFKLVRKTKYVLLGSIALGVAIGVVMSKTQTRYYGIDLVATSSVSSERATWLVNYLEQSVQSENYDLLKSKLNVSEDAAKSMRSISAIAAPDKESGKDDLSDRTNWFEIHLEVYNIAYLEEVKKGLLYLFENNKYISGRLTTKRSQLSVLIDSYNRKLAEIDTMDSQASLVRAKVGEVLIVNTEHAQQVDYMQLLRERSRLEEELSLLNAATFMNEGNAFELSRGTSFFAVAYGIAFFFIGLLLSILYLLYNKLKQRISE